MKYLIFWIRFYLIILGNIFKISWYFFIDNIESLYNFLRFYIILILKYYFFFVVFDWFDELLLMFIVI